MSSARSYSWKNAILLLLYCSFCVSVVAWKTESLANSQITISDVQQCEAVRRLSTIKEDVEAGESPVMRRIFAVLFPFENPGWNAVLGTFYISSVPNFILAVIPSQINSDTLNTMTAFATGGLLSDVFLHLVPHSFMGEHQEPGVHFVMVEEKRNILIGLGIFIGFAVFFVMEKTLRVLSGEEESGHSHSHSHVGADSSNGVSSNVSTSDKSGLRKRSGDTKVANGDARESREDEHQGKHTTGPSKLSAYLNLFGDFVHNITDGLAMAASFYSSPLIGATTTLACFAHEIPHEIADYSILVRSGFSKRQAMQSQYITAVGAFVSTVLCCLTFMRLNGLSRMYANGSSGSGRLGESIS
ncbi:hypothetical protein ACEPAG_6962 [Sanghuangporus baumii]